MWLKASVAESLLTRALFPQILGIERLAWCPNVIDGRLRE